MLVVVVIMLILLAAVLPVVLEGLERRGVREGARQVQAALTAAHDRALSEQRTYGVRFNRDQSNRWEVTSIEYVAEPEPYTRGRASADSVNNFIDPVDNRPIGIITGPVANAWNGLVQPGDRIRLLDSGPIYTIKRLVPVPGFPDRIVIDSWYIGPLLVNVPYKIFRQPQPVAGAEPLNLPEDVVINVSPNAKPPGLPSTLFVERRSRYIPFQFGFEQGTPWNFIWVMGGNVDGMPGTDDDLPGNSLDDDDRDGIVDNPSSVDTTGDGVLDDPGDRSGLAELGFPGTGDVAPAAWPPMDILFAPSGLPTGIAADRPMIHIWVEKRGSTTASASREVVIDDALLVTLFTRTGYAGAFEVHIEDLDPNNPGTDPNNLGTDYYFYAEQAFGAATQ